MNSKAKALAGHLEAAAPTIANPFHFLAVVMSWLSSALSGFIDTPEERAAIEAVVMTQYDKLTLSLMSSNQALGMVFGGMRPVVRSGLDMLLLALVPAPPPTPTPTPAPVPPAGAAP